VDEYLTQCNTIKVEFNIDKVFVLKRGLPVIIVTFYKGVRKYLWSPLKWKFDNHAKLNRTWSSNETWEEWWRI